MINFEPKNRPSAEEYLEKASKEYEKSLGYYGNNKYVHLATAVGGGILAVLTHYVDTTGVRLIPVETKKEDGSEDQIQEQS